MKQYFFIKYFIKVNWAEILFFSFLWLIIYVEPINIGPLKISQIWKTIMIFGCFLYIISGKKFPGFLWFGIFFSFKYLIYDQMPYGYMRAIQDALEKLIFPLFLALFYIYYKKSIDAQHKLIHIAILLSLFIIFSSVPLLFGLKTLNKETNLEKYGLASDAMKGLFYHIASASKLYTIATIVLINTYKRFTNNFINKLIWVVGVILGIYFIYKSWTRTAWLIFLIALAFSLFYGKNVKHKIRGIVMFASLLISMFWIYQSNEALQLRLKGGTTYRTDTELTIEQLSSARLPFIFVAIDNLKEEGISSQLFGYGTQKGIDLFEKKTGMPIVSHNATFEILESSGLLGLSLYLIFLILLIKAILKKLNGVSLDIRRLTLVSLIMFFGFFLTSHGTPLWGEIIFSCFFVAVLLNKKTLRIRANER